MRTDTLTLEAEQCRRQANAFSGRPEGSLLLRMAGMYDELARQRARPATGIERCR